MVASCRASERLNSEMPDGVGVGVVVRSGAPWRHDKQENIMHRKIGGTLAAVLLLASVAASTFAQAAGGGAGGGAAGGAATGGAAGAGGATGASSGTN